MHYSNRDILEAFKKGMDDAVLPFLYKEVLPKVKYYIIKNRGNNEEAKDIFQDAVLIFYKKAKMKELPEDINVTSYICLISKNLWINRVKKMNRTVEMIDTENFMSSDNHLENIITEEKKATINSLLSEIGEECKNLLKYSVYENRSMKEICQLMGFSNENVAKTYNYRCKHKLMQLVKNKKMENILRE